jgi:hypothetical protein
MANTAAAGWGGGAPPGSSDVTDAPARDTDKLIKMPLKIKCCTNPRAIAHRCTIFTKVRRAADQFIVLLVIPAGNVTVIWTLVRFLCNSSRPRGCLQTDGKLLDTRDLQTSHTSVHVDNKLELCTIFVCCCQVPTT